MSIAKIGGIGIAGALFLGLVTAPLYVERIDEGQVGVVYSPAGGVKETINPGWNVVGVFDKVTEYPVRLQTVKDKINVSTNDGKKITLSVTYNMKVNSSKDKVIKIFKELGSQDIEQIQKGYLYSQLYKASREVVSDYSLLDIYGSKTTEASDRVTKDFAKLVEPLGFEISNVTLGAPDADPNTQAAIDARIKASQENEKKKLELENDKIDAQRKEVQANGEAKKRQIDAEAEAKANETVARSITEPLLKKQELDARMKHGWVTIQGANTVVKEGQQ